jgi:hypothetical protein
MHVDASKRELAHYFEYSGVGLQVESDGLPEVRFGEFLVEKNALSRQQLLAALMEQDRQPGLPIGEVIAALGFVSYEIVDRLLGEFLSIDVVEVD